MRRFPSRAPAPTSTGILRSPMVLLGVALMAFSWMVATACAAPETPPEGSQSPLPQAETQANAARPEPPDLRSRRQGIDWPRFLGPNSDGKSPETGLHLAWSESGPNLAWHRSVGEGYSMPSTSLGRLFLFDQLGQTARLTCLHAETGEPLWQQTYTSRYEDLYGYSNGPRTTPVVDGERVYSFGVEGRLRAHDVRDGRLLWDVDTGQNFGVVQNFFGVGSTPVIEGDLLIVMVGGSPPDSPAIHSGNVRGNGSAMVAFDKLDGTVRYRLSDELASYASPILTSLHGRRYGFAFTRGGLLAFDPAQGQQDFFVPWRAKKLESVNAATPVVFEDRVFITESYGPGALMLRVGVDGPEVVWQDGRRQQAMASHWTTPIYHEGFLYGCSGQSSGNAVLRCLDADTGQVIWSQSGLRRSTLLYIDGHFVALGEYGELQVFEATPDAFRQVAFVDLGDGAGASSAKRPIYEDRGPESDGPPRLRFPAWNAPVLSHGMLYVRGKDQLLAFDLLPADQAVPDDPAAATESAASIDPTSKEGP